MSHAEETRVQLPELKTEELIAGNGLRNFYSGFSLKRLGILQAGRSTQPIVSKKLCGVDQQNDPLAFSAEVPRPGSEKRGM